ncbi:hypothetical protein LguiA_005800 [Lonicera macranthoides]
MVHKTVLKVEISCEKCKKKLLKAVSGLEGVDKIEIDGAKGTLTITGDADPYEIIVRTRKTGKFVEVVTIGPPPAPPKPDPPKKPEEKKVDEKKTDEKKPDEKKAEAHIHMPYVGHGCPICERMAFVYYPRYDYPHYDGDAIEGMNDQSLDGCNITVNETQSRGNSGGGGSDGYFCDNKYGGHHDGGGSRGYGRHESGGGCIGGYDIGGYDGGVTAERVDAPMVVMAVDLAT